jgi:hypothetical protein
MFLVAFNNLLRQLIKIVNNDIKEIEQIDFKNLKFYSVLIWY